MDDVSVLVQEEPFDAGKVLNEFSAQQQGVGAVVSFTGIVRDVAAGLDHMEIEHYPAMTAKAILAICEEARERWALTGVQVIHRYGKLRADDPIMMVLTASAHRADAFAAADFLMDFLKSRAPFWKKETTSESADWVAAKDEDEDALSRWACG